MRLPAGIALAATLEGNAYGDAGSVRRRRTAGVCISAVGRGVGGGGGGGRLHDEGEGCAREMPLYVVLGELSVWIRVEACAHSCNHVLERVRSEFAERACASKRM